MNQGFTIEKVTRDDKGEIEELSSHIWEGHDYIPDIFDEWVDDEGFYCGKLDGKIIALDKFTLQKNDVIWLEGLRVHPDYRGEGYARKMVDGLMDILEEYDYSYLRFLTTAGKDPVKKMAEDHGFYIKQVYKYLLIDEEMMDEIDKITVADIKLAEVQSDLDEILNFIYDSEEYIENKKQYMAHWTTYDITDELIREEIEKENCFMIRGGEDIEAVIFFYYYEPYDTLSIPYVSGSKEDISELMRFGLKICKERDHTNYTIKTASEKVIDCAEDIGMRPSDHYEILLYEKSNQSNCR